MRPERILEEQRIIVKRGRMNGLGYEPAWNCFFDFYLSTRYIDPPLLQLEDVTFFLFIRKNINDSNPDWHMPSIRQIKKKFGIGQGKIEAMMGRLERAHLLQKVSGIRTDGPNVNNNYELSDPVPALDEFLLLVEAGVFDPVPETGTPPAPETGTPYVSEIGTPPIPEIGRDQQTSNQHTDDNKDFMIWKSVKALLKQHLPANSYNLYLEDTELMFINENCVTLVTFRPHAKDWIEMRMAKRIIGLLNTELCLMNGAESGTIKAVEVRVLSTTDEGVKQHR